MFVQILPQNQFCSKHTKKNKFLAFLWNKQNISDERNNKKERKAINYRKNKTHFKELNFI